MSSGPFIPPVSVPQDSAGAAIGNIQKRVQILESVSPAVAGVSMWPMSYDLLQYDVINMSAVDAEAAPFWPSPVTRDTAYLKNYYTEATADQTQWLSYMRLGPKGSIWCVNLVADQGTDCGKLQFSWATINEETSAAGNGYSDNGAGMVAGSTDRAALTYFTTDANQIDLYNNPAILHDDFAYLSPFRIGGEDGATLTANATQADPDDNAKSFDGGSGMWVLSMKVIGQNASSSGFRSRIEGFWVRRLTSDLLSQA